MIRCLHPDDDDDDAKRCPFILCAVTLLSFMVCSSPPPSLRRHLSISVATRCRHSKRRRRHRVARIEASVRQPYPGGRPLHRLCVPPGNGPRRRGRLTAELTRAPWLDWRGPQESWRRRGLLRCPSWTPPEGRCFFSKNR